MMSRLLPRVGLAPGIVPPLCTAGSTSKLVVCLPGRRRQRQPFLLDQGIHEPPNLLSIKPADGPRSLLERPTQEDPITQIQNDLGKVIRLRELPVPSPQEFAQVRGHPRQGMRGLAVAGTDRLNEIPLVAGEHIRVGETRGLVGLGDRGLVGHGAARFRFVSGLIAKHAQNREDTP